MDADGDTLVYDWLTDARLRIRGNPDWKPYLNHQLEPYLVFDNADLSNPINDSAWVYCLVRDPWGGSAGGRAYVILRPE